MELSKKSLKRYSKNALIEMILLQAEQTKMQVEQIKMQDKQIETQASQIKVLEERIARLEKDSQTSSKAPSGDNKKPNKNQSLREKSGKEPGGQKGHAGSVRRQTDSPDEVIQCKPKGNCEACGNLLDLEASESVEKRQEIEIPTIKPKVTEYQKMEIRCACGHCNQGQFPEEIKAYVQIGKVMKSFLIYLNVVQLLPYQRLTDVTRDLFNFTLSKRTIENALEEAKNKGTPLYNQIMRMVKKGSWTGSDETGAKVLGKRWWEWVWQNEHASYYAIDKSRGYKVVKDHFGEDYTGILCHDCWSAHNNTVAKGGHQQCHPHIQRDLKFLIKTYNSKWAYQLNVFLQSAQKARPIIWAPSFDPQLRQDIIHHYYEQLKGFLVKDSEQKDVKRLQKRIVKHQASILLFMNDPHTPFHNNSSEGAIRMFKVKQKISGGFRSQHGAVRYSILLSIIETAKKQKMNLLEAIQLLLNGSLSFRVS